MLYDFLILHRENLIQRCRSKGAGRHNPETTGIEPDHGISSFLNQVIKALEAERDSRVSESRTISGPSGGMPMLSDIGTSAKQHGRELLQHGFTVDQVVHQYGDLCQAISDAALEAGKKIEVDEFRTVNRCLDNAIADAVTEFSRQTNLGMHERMGALVHEIRNYAQSASLALAALKTGQVAIGGSTGAILDRALKGMVRLVNAAIGEVRVVSGLPPLHEVVKLAELIAEVAAAAALEAKFKDCTFRVAEVDPRLDVDVERSMLVAALHNS